MDSVQIVDYSTTSYSSVYSQITKRVEELKSENAGLDFDYEINIISYFNSVKQVESVVYYIKYYSIVSQFNLMFKKTENRNTYTFETVKTTVAY